MSYSSQAMAAAVAALVAAVHGIREDVAQAWATAEQGVAYNILGVTYTDATGQHLYAYGSWAEGAQAAASLIAASPYYAGIRAALAGGTSQAQAAAIIASPWNHPYYSHGAGAAALRAIAAAPSALGSPAQVSIVGPTPVRDASGAPVHGTVTRATYRVGPRSRVGGLWQYPILDHPGWWVRPTRYTRFS